MMSEYQHRMYPKNYKIVRDGRVLNALVKRGFINEWDEKHKYINDYNYTNTSIIYNNKIYHIEYFDGCFNPFVVVVININLNK
tara:strand:+ start:226 stop:474 length:249 start_codon:yes stop_codon:yes gene_type:complete